jgi:transcriptional regulator with XRE-family HTH domain
LLELFGNTGLTGDYRRKPFAEAAGIHHTYVGLLEHGERKPTIDVADRLAKALGVKLSTLISEAEDDVQRNKAAR